MARLAGLLSAWLIAGPVSADVDFYVTPEVIVSGLFVETDGRATGTNFQSFQGDDRDATPLAGLAVGLEMPMDELVPREWLADLRLPRWPLRFELESTAVYDFDFQTNGLQVGDKFSTEIFGTNFFANAAMDVPLEELWRPVQYLFGLGRQPRLRRLIEPGAFFIRSGIGMTYLEFEGGDNVFFVDDDVIDFAWNVGAGFNYRFNDRVKLTLGYRYVGLGVGTGEQSVDLERRGAVTVAGEEIDYDLQSHEFHLGFQIRCFSFPSAWR